VVRLGKRRAGVSVEPGNLADDGRRAAAAGRKDAAAGAAVPGGWRIEGGQAKANAGRVADQPRRHLPGKLQPVAGRNLPGSEVGAGGEGVEQEVEVIAGIARLVPARGGQLEAFARAVAAAALDVAGAARSLAE